MRVGIGYDVHRFTPEKPLILGGIEIPCDMGLLGHSDADVLVHAICDALLGAAGMRDIGFYFPDTDDSIKGISSLIILEEVCKMLESEGFGIINIDTIIIAQWPKVGAYVADMKNCLAKVCNLDPSQIGIKATTTEGLGFEGRKEGISAHSVALIGKLENLD